MVKRSEQQGETHEDEPGPTDLRSSVQVFTSHQEARSHEIRQQASRTPYERMVQFMELQQRVWGRDNPDVRESGAVNIEWRGD